MGHRMVFGTMAASLAAVVVAAGVLHELNMTAGDAVPAGRPAAVAASERQAESGSPSQSTATGLAMSDLSRSLQAERMTGGTAHIAAAPMPAPPPVAQFHTRIARAEPGLAAAEFRGREVHPAVPAPRQLADTPTNELKLVAEAPVSTFSIDVDTASYAQVRRALRGGALPAPAAVRVEEMINYFSYDYPLPEAGGAPFRPSVALYPTPWNAETRLLHIGIKGRDIVANERPRANLVFLIDTSGSMQGPDRLPLLKTAFRMLLDTLDGDDSVAIVTYAGSAGTVLEPTPASEKRKILGAIAALEAGGSTAGAAGIAEAYALAESAFDKEGVNRVILATDGDFNVGMTDHGSLKDFIANKRRSGIFLSVLGFGEGNYNDALMQTLAQNGNGSAAYIDTLKEAEKVLVHEATSTLFPIAKDVKIQVEFNPANVAAYRLIGYETRMLARQDFNNDRVDAGEIGSGHAVTAIYEIVPAGGGNALVDPLRYGRAEAPAPTTNNDEYALLRLRYKAPDSDRSELIELPVTKGHELASVAEAGEDTRFAAAVAAFGQKLRGGAELADYRFEEIEALAAAARGSDPFGFRAELVDLVRLARYVSPEGFESSGGRDRR